MASINTDVAAINLSDDQPLAGRWVAPLIEVEGHQYVVVDRTDAFFGRYVSSQYTMLEHIISLRNAATELLMRALSKRDDPTLGDDPRALHMPKRPKKELIDDIAPTTVVEVEVDTGEKFQVKVCTSSTVRSRLAIECTPEALKVLAMKPKHEANASGADPEFESERVRWHRSRHSVGVNYFDKNKRAWRLKSMKVEPGADLDARAQAMAAVLETFYNQHHTDPALVGPAQPSPAKP